MINKFIYPDVISNVKNICKRHISGEVSIDELQRAIAKSEAIVVAMEEKDIRSFLFDVENKIELIRFTVDNHLQIKETRIIAQSVIDWLNDRGK